MSETANISLNAIGKQDIHLITKNVENSFFRTEHKSHSDFYKQQRIKTIYNVHDKADWPWGETIKVKYEPQTMGDLLSNMAINIPLPAFTNNPPQNLDKYAPMIGYHLIKSVTMYVDEIKVEKIDSDWDIIHHNIYQDIDEKQMSEINLNRGWSHRIWSTNFIFKEIHKKVVPITLPLKFFFCRRFETTKMEKPYFPICAIHKQKIEFEIEFHKKTFFTPSTNNLKIDKFDIITDEISLTPEERLYYMKNKQILTTEFVFKHPTYQNEPPLKEIVANLVPNIPVKSLHWFIRNSDFEKEENPVDTSFGDVSDSLSNGTTYQQFAHYNNRYNFSSVLPIGQLKDDIYSEYDNVDNINIYINGENIIRTNESGPKYFRFYTCSKSSLSLPKQHHIYTYSFSLDPKTPSSSGYFNFENTDSDKTFIRVNIKNNIVSPPRNGIWNMHIYYTGYRTLVFENGFMKI